MTEEKTKVWWQIKLEEQEREIERLKFELRNDEPSNTLYQETEYLKQLLAEKEQRIAALERKNAAMDQAASYLLQTHEEALSIIENFDSYTEHYHERNFGPQMVALAGKMRTAEQRFRRER